MAATDLLRPHPDASIDDTLEGLPPRIKRLLRSSFGVLVSFDGEKRSAVVAHTAAAITTPGYGFDEIKFSESFGVTAEQASHIANGATFLSALVSGFSELTSAELLEKLAAHDLFAPENREKLAEWLDYLRSNSERFLAEIETGSLTNRVLPTLARFELSVDIRLAESPTNKPPATPVIVAVLDTDAEGQIVWFQMSKAQLMRMQSQLGSILQQLERAEKFVTKMSEIPR